MDIKQARDAYMAALPHAREVAALAFEDEMRDLTVAVEAAVVRAYADGMSISQLCREYGTSARVTVTDVLKAHGVYKPSQYRGNRKNY